MYGRVFPFLYKQSNINNIIKTHTRLLKTSNYAHSVTKMVEVVQSEEAQERFKRTKKYAAGVVQKLCEGKESMTIPEWDNFKIEVMSQCLKLKKENFNGLIMDIFLKYQFYSLGKSFMHYLQTRKENLNFVILSRYIALCGLSPESSEEEIVQLYNFFPQMDILDKATAENIIVGLCATTYWKKSLAVLSKVEFTIPTAKTLGTIACAAFKNNNANIAYEMLNKLEEEEIIITEKVFEAWINYLYTLKKEPVQSLIAEDKLFRFLRENLICITESSAKKLSDYFQSKRWKTKFTTANPESCTCSECGKKLKLIKLEQHKFEKLKEALLRKVLKQSNIFINTTPWEFKHYKKFIQSTKPYDYVVDGLNMACLQNDTANVHSKHRDTTLSAFQLLSVVQKLEKENKKVMVLGRKHMLKWPKASMNELRNIAECFFIDNISNDDPYILYGALESGLGTKLVSNDLMRNHLFKLRDSNLKDTFIQWQQSHQMFIRDDLKLLEPLQYSIVAQGRGEDSWHVPYDDGEEIGPYEKHNKWLCISK